MSDIPRSFLLHVTPLAGGRRSRATGSAHPTTTSIEIAMLSLHTTIFLTLEIQTDSKVLLQTLHFEKMMKKSWNLFVCKTCAFDDIFHLDTEQIVCFSILLMIFILTKPAI